MTNIEVVNIISALSTISEKRLPVKLGFAVAKNQKTLESIYKVYNIEREKLLNLYAEKDENGESIIENSQVKLTEPQAFGKDLQDLLDLENEVDVHKIDFADLEYDEKYDLLTVGELKALDFMIK